MKSFTTIIAAAILLATPVLAYDAPKDLVIGTVLSIPSVSVPACSDPIGAGY